MGKKNAVIQGRSGGKMLLEPQETQNTLAASLQTWSKKERDCGAKGHKLKGKRKERKRVVQNRAM